jgi:phosphate transport system permease protein
MISLANTPKALRLRTRRKASNLAVMTLCSLGLLSGVAMLSWVLLTLVQRGIGGFSWAFFTQLPHPPGEPGGGLANAVVGTALVTSLASMCGIPAGIAAGVWLAEFSHGSRLGHAVRFLLDVLMGIPSIVIGVFVYGVLVAPLGGFSAMAGAVALALLMLPIIARTTEEMLRAVPVPLREASLALGAPIWRTVVHVAMRAALPGILTGVLLSIARVAGETAPLLFTALNSPYWSFDLHKPIGTLNVTLFQYAMSPYAEWQQLAWAAALVITGGVLALTLLGRLVRRRRG